MPDHIVLAYSGGFDTSFLVHWLGNEYHADVTCVLIDMGQPLGDLEAAKARALQNGADDCIIIDAKDEFVAGPVTTAITCNLRYQGGYPLATALGRPLIAQKLVEVAHAIGADAVAHGCTGKGNDQVRIEAAVSALDPTLLCLAPQRTHPMTRDVILDYAAQNGVQLPLVKQSPWSTDENLWGRSVEGNELEDLHNAVPEAAYDWVASPMHAPDEAVELAVTFQSGVPVALDGVQTPLADIIGHLNTVAGAHGIGRIDVVEDRLVGIKSREVYEAPAAVTILAAKQALEQVTLTKEEQRLKPMLEQRLGEMVYDGQWYAPAGAAIQAALGTMQQAVSGTIVVRLWKGNLTVLSRDAPEGLYDHALATYDTGDAFDHGAATGFIHIWSLPMRGKAAARVLA